MDNTTTDKVGMFFHRFISTLHKSSEEMDHSLAAQRMKNEDGSDKRVDFPVAEPLKINKINLGDKFARVPTWGSFYRIPAQTTCDKIKPQDGATISRQEVPGQQVLTVRPRAVMGQTNSKVGEDEKIAEEIAVCRFCFNRFVEENALKTVCGCSNGLMHEDCAGNWSRDQRYDNKCNYCEKDVLKIPVTLLTNLSSAQIQPEGTRRGWFSRFQSKEKH